MWEYVWLFVASFIGTVIMTPIVSKIAVKFNLIDKPNERKVHKKPIPRIGGVAIYLGVVIGYFALGLYEKEITGIVAGSLVILLTGLLDDIFQIKPSQKLFGQSLAAFMVIGSGLSIDVLYIPFVGNVETGAVGLALTWFWILAVCNAINLIDGLDGLSTGVSIVVLSTISVMAILTGMTLIFALCLLVLGSLFGFLIFNFHPAKIFMGDSGSLFLGYAISVISVLGMFKSVTLFSLVIPVILLGVPILDTTCSIIRRILNKKPISLADRSHLHHRLLDKGYSHRKTVLIIYGISIIFSIIAIVTSTTTLFVSYIILFVVMVASGVFADSIGLFGEKRFIKIKTKNPQKSI